MQSIFELFNLAIRPVEYGEEMTIPLKDRIVTNDNYQTGGIRSILAKQLINTFKIPSGQQKYDKDQS